MPQSLSALPAVRPLTPAPMMAVRGSGTSGMEASLLGAQPDRAGHARAAQAAVPVRVLGQVLLVVLLGVVERAGRRDLRRDLPVAGAGQPLREHGLGGLRRLALGVVGGVDRRSVLGADVVALPHALGRV